MKTYLECIPCFISQALRAGREACKDERLIKELLDSVCCKIKDFSLESSSPEMAYFIYQEIKRITGVADPFASQKKESIREALAMSPKLHEILESSDDKLLTAIRIAIAGNVIDLGVNADFDIARDLRIILKQEFALNDYVRFKEALSRTNKVLYLGDNAGESVFDKILIEQLGKPTIYAVRDDAIINDVTMQDAIDSGIESIAEIISSGCPAPSTIINMCSEEFLELFNSVDLIISKGQGNYEGLSETKRPVFFMLKAKCNVIARDLGVQLGDIVLKAAV